MQMYALPDHLRFNSGLLTKPDVLDCALLSKRTHKSGSAIM